MPKLTPELSTFENIDIQKALKHIKKPTSVLHQLLKQFPHSRLNRIIQTLCSQRSLSQLFINN